MPQFCRACKFKEDKQVIHGSTARLLDPTTVPKEPSDPLGILGFEVQGRGPDRGS